MTLSPKREAGTCASAGTKDNWYGDICKSYRATIHFLIFIVSFRMSLKSQHSLSSSSICAFHTGLFSIIIYCHHWHPNTMLPACSLQYPTPSCLVASMIFLYLHAPRARLSSHSFTYFLLTVWQSTCSGAMLILVSCGYLLVVMWTYHHLHKLSVSRMSVEQVGFQRWNLLIQAKFYLLHSQLKIYLLCCK